MATSKGQRIGIIIIAVVMAVGTIGSFFVMILASKNSAADQKKTQEQYEKQMADYKKQMEEYEKQQKEEAGRLSAQYFEQFNQFVSLPEPFDASKVKSLETKDLEVGDGEEIGDNTRYRAYYIGWNSEGKVFDSSIEGDKLKLPIEGGVGLIEGWVQGVKGMKIGGVRVISIPGHLAKGLAPSADIKEGAPLKFVVMAIPPAANASEQAK